MTAAGLIELLDRLNRKERFFLVSDAVVGKPRFRLTKGFRQKIRDATGVQVPEDAYAWMDYHLDWLYAALVLAHEGEKESYPSPKFPPAKGGTEPLNVNANQEDIDLVVAFEDDGTTQLVLIEAKGVTGFATAVLRSKAGRLAAIFGKDGTRYRDVKPCFLLASPKEPMYHSSTYKQGLMVDGLLPWMLHDGKLAHMPLLLPPDRIGIQRWDPDTKKPSQGGTRWRLRPGMGI